MNHDRSSNTQKHIQTNSSRLTFASFHSQSKIKCKFAIGSEKSNHINGGILKEIIYLSRSDECGNISIEHSYTLIIYLKYIARKWHQQFEQMDDIFLDDS